MRCFFWRSASTPEKTVDFVLSNQLIAPLQVRSELLEFSRIVREANPRIVLEIGTFSGGTLFVLARACQRNATVISVDIGRTNLLRKAMFKSFAINGGKVIPLMADSHVPETYGLVSQALRSSKVDLLFIDGDHSYNGVKRDFEMYVPLVRSGGMVAFHDIAEHPPEAQCEVSRFWNELKTRYKHLEIIENHDQGWAGIGVLYV